MGVTPRILMPWQLTRQQPWISIGARSEVARLDGSVDYPILLSNNTFYISSAKELHKGGGRQGDTHHCVIMFREGHAIGFDVFSCTRMIIMAPTPTCMNYKPF